MTASSFVTARLYREKIPMVILAAGDGERLGSKTTLIPKPAIGVGDVSIIESAVLEGLNAGLDEFYIVCTSNQLAQLKTLLTPTTKQRSTWMHKRNKYFSPETIRIWDEANITFVLQNRKLGKGDGFALSAVAPFVFRRKFVLFFADVIADTDEAGINIVEQALNAHSLQNEPVVMLATVSRDIISSFGAADYDAIDEVNVQLKGFVEKPPIPKDAPSTEVAIGVYVVTPDVMQHGAFAKIGKDEELRYADYMIGFLEGGGKITGRILKGIWLDTGSLDSLAIAQVDALRKSIVTGPSVEQYLEKAGYRKMTNQLLQAPLQELEKLNTIFFARDTDLADEAVESFTSSMINASSLNKGEKLQLVNKLIITILASSIAQEARVAIDDSLRANLTTINNPVN